MSLEVVMTLTSATIPEFWIIGFYIAVATTAFALISVVLFVWGRRKSPQERAQLYLIHERMTHIADPAPVRR